MSVTTTEIELKSWLKILLAKENLLDFSMQVIGSTEKGDGYVGDVFFVSVTATTCENRIKTYDLVLKCAKRSESLRKKTAVKEAFLNEIYFYDVIYPSFAKFQEERQIERPFNNVPKCFATYCTDGMEILALQNLKTKGYILWDREKPLTQKHIYLLIENYAKLHAISIAMKDQEPNAFQQIVDGLVTIYSKLLDMGFQEAFTKVVSDLYQLIKNDVNINAAKKLEKLIKEIGSFFDVIKSSHLDGVTVIIHGDNWNNNFMHKHTNNEATDSILIDWQLARISSPIIDIATFLFACISSEDIDNLESILKFYHRTLCDHLKQLGSSANLYLFEDFLNDWKKYAKIGVILASMIHKVSYTSADELPDMAKTAESEEDIATSFVVKAGDTTKYEKRMIYLVNAAAKLDII